MPINFCKSIEEAAYRIGTFSISYCSGLPAIHQTKEGHTFLKNGFTNKC